MRQARDTDYAEAAEFDKPCGGRPGMGGELFPIRKIIGTNPDSASPAQLIGDGGEMST